MSMVKCLGCGQVLESKHRHDFVRCNCSNQTFVDGGNDYLRAGGKDLTLILTYHNSYWKNFKGEIVDCESTDHQSSS